MNEAQTRFDLIDPALREAGWTVVPESNIKVEVITAGRIIGKNHKGERIRKKPLSCDYVLEYRGRRLAVIEAKARDKYYTDGLAQAKDYAVKTDAFPWDKAKGRTRSQPTLAHPKPLSVTMYPRWISN